jgi:hypothetical protein
MNSDSGTCESAMSVLFLRDQRQDFRAMIEEVAERVEDLRLGNSESLGNVNDRFATLMQRNHVADSHPQPVNDRLASANALQPDDVRMFGFHSLGHTDSPKDEVMTPFEA